MVDALWGGIVRWASVGQPALVAAQQRRLLSERILAHPEGPRILEKFDALADEPAVDQSRTSTLRTPA